MGKCNPYLIKIDVEGFELDVIKGLQETLRRESPIVICEILPNYLDKNSERYKRQIELEEILVKLDYSVYRVDEQNSKLMHLANIGLFESMDETNYVFVHKSKVSIISELVN